MFAGGRQSFCCGRGKKDVDGLQQGMNGVKTTLSPLTQQALMETAVFDCVQDLEVRMGWHSQPKPGTRKYECSQFAGAVLNTLIGTRTTQSAVPAMDTLA